MLCSTTTLTSSQIDSLGSSRLIDRASLISLSTTAMLDQPTNSFCQPIAWEDDEDEDDEDFVDDDEDLDVGDEDDEDFFEDDDEDGDDDEEELDDE